MTRSLDRTDLDRVDVETLDEETVYRGTGKLHRYKVRYRRYDGSWCEPLTRELFDTGDAVVVLPYDPVRDEVVLVEQFRISAYARGVKPWLIECIAGRVGKDEAPEEVAVREAREEADCAVVDLIQIGGMFISPGMIAEYVTMFCARCDSSTVGGVHGLDDEHEDIRVMAVPFEAALAALEQGRILTSPAFVCLNWLARNRDNLKRRWIEPR